MKKLFIADKQSKAHAIREKEYFTENDSLIVARGILSYFFNYPHQLKYKELPITEAVPLYKYNSSPLLDKDDFSFLNLKKGINQYHQESLVIKKNDADVFLPLEKLRVIFLSIANQENIYSQYDLELARKDVLTFIESFDEIICISDTIVAGVRGLNHYFEKFLGVNNFINSDIARNITYYFPYHEEPYENTLYLERKKITEDSFYLRMREAYKKKDYFSYNFNLNSLVMIGDILRKLNCNPTKVFTMKMLQTLIFFKSKIKDNESLRIDTKNLSNDRMDYGMADNHTLVAIDTYLSELGLIKEPRDGIYQYNLTEKSLEFLDLLHPKMKDPKLSLNVQRDIYNEDMSFDEFKEKYDKKINLMFKKQKRFSSTRKQI